MQGTFDYSETRGPVAPVLNEFFPEIKQRKKIYSDAIYAENITSTNTAWREKPPGLQSTGPSRYWFQTGTRHNEVLRLLKKRRKKSLSRFDLRLEKDE